MTTDELQLLLALAMAVLAVAGFLTTLIDKKNGWAAVFGIIFVLTCVLLISPRIGSAADEWTVNKCGEDEITVLAMSKIMPGNVELALHRIDKADVLGVDTVELGKGAVMTFLTVRARPTGTSILILRRGDPNEWLLACVDGIELERRRSAF